MTDQGRRDNRAGTVYEEPDGRWRAEIRWKDSYGRQRRARASAADEAGAKRALRKLQSDVAAGRAPANGRATVEAYWKAWREGPLRAGDRKESTIRLYTTVMGQHVLPALGGMRLTALTAGDVERMLAGMVTQRPHGDRPKGSPVSGQTRRTAHAVLCIMLTTAVRDGLVPVNVADQVDRPKVDTAEADYLSAEQLRGLLDGLRGHRIYPLILLLASTGMRVGEGLALRWQDVDLDAGVLRVTGTVHGYGETATRTAPKSLRSRRTLPIGADVVAALTAWKATQSTERLAAGTAWHRGPHEWIFTTNGGHVLDARNAARQYARAIDEAKLGVPARFHLLRHTAASLMLGDAQVPVRVASEVLGHGSTRLTADTYSHVNGEQKRAALDVVAQAFAR